MIKYIYYPIITLEEKRYIENTSPNRIKCHVQNDQNNMYSTLKRYRRFEKLNSINIKQFHTIGRISRRIVSKNYQYVDRWYVIHAFISYENRNNKRFTNTTGYINNVFNLIWILFLHLWKWKRYDKLDQTIISYY